MKCPHETSLGSTLFSALSKTLHIAGHIRTHCSWVSEQDSQFQKACLIHVSSVKLAKPSSDGKVFEEGGNPSLAGARQVRQKGGGGGRRRNGKLSRKRREKVSLDGWQRRKGVFLLSLLPPQHGWASFVPLPLINDSSQLAATPLLDFQLGLAPGKYCSIVTFPQKKEAGVYHMPRVARSIIFWR